VGILRDVAAALAAMHGASPASLVHRDLKMVGGMALTETVEVVVVVWGGGKAVRAAGTRIAGAEGVADAPDKQGCPFHWYCYCNPGLNLI
jgi:hypothetical protein